MKTAMMRKNRKCFYRDKKYTYTCQSFTFFKKSLFTRSRITLRGRKRSYRHDSVLVATPPGGVCSGPEKNGGEAKCRSRRPALKMLGGCTFFGAAMTRAQTQYVKQRIFWGYEFLENKIVATIKLMLFIISIYLLWL